MKRYLILIILLFVSACDKNEVTKIYYENGQLKTEMFCKVGEADRIIESYYENGKIKN